MHKAYDLTMYLNLRVDYSSGRYVSLVVSTMPPIIVLGWMTLRTWPVRRDSRELDRIIINSLTTFECQNELGLVRGYGYFRADDKSVRPMTAPTLKHDCPQPDCEGIELQSFATPLSKTTKTTTTTITQQQEDRQRRRDEKRECKLRIILAREEMKFSHSIQFNAVPDWSSHYISYSNLKKL